MTDKIDRETLSPEMKAVVEIYETISDIGHDESAVIPIWPRDWVMPDGTVHSYDSYPKLTVGAFNKLVETYISTLIHNSNGEN